MITVIAGTNRPGSATRQVAGQVAEMHAAVGACHTTLLDLGELPPELFLPASYARKPAGFAPFALAVQAAAGVVFVTPEYNGSIPGVLKVFIDHLPFPASLERKPVCFVGLADGQWGGLRPVEHLQQICLHRHALLYPERVFIPHVGSVLDRDGQVNEPGLRQRLQAQAEGFGRFCLEAVARS